MTGITERKSILAKLLAKENISVIEGAYETASFDVTERVLRLPLWKDKGVDVYDLLVGHEVGHALFTPTEGWHDSFIDVEGIPRSYLNIIEDIRIERAIQTQYPGLVGSFKRAYRILFDDNFFGTAERDITSYGLPDRINIKAKLADLQAVPFTEEEAPVVKKCFTVKTWEDVVEAARELYEFVKESQKNEPNEAGQPSPLPNPSEETADDSQNGQKEEESEVEQSAESNQSGDEAAGDESEPMDSSDESSNSNEGGTKKVSQLPENNPDVVETDDHFRKKESELIERDRRGSIPATIAPFTNKDIGRIVVGYKELLNSREENFLNESGALCKELVATYMEDYSNYIKENDLVAKTMAKEFEMRKAAYRYSRAKVSKKGVIDVNKLHSYKYNEDIFARNLKLADSKSHGLLMLVDYSGSMANTLGQVIRQCVSLSMFAKKVGIPFRVYGFTSNFSSRAATLNLDTNLILERVSMFEVLTSEMSKADYETALRQLYVQSRCIMENPSRIPPYMCEIDHYGGTPLTESLLIMDKIIPEFKARYNLQKVNLTVLTDGMGSSVKTRELVKNMHRYADERQNLSRDRVSLNVSNQRGVFANNSSLANDVVALLKKAHDITAIGYFIPEGNHEFRHKAYMAGFNSETDISDLRREYLKKKFVNFGSVFGYDDFFVIRSGKVIDTATGNLDVKEGAKKGELTREFKKFAGSKKSSRMFASQFAQAIA